MPARSTTALAAALTALALGAPTAHAIPAMEPLTGSADPDAAASRPVVVRTVDDGIAWDSAAAGAGGAAAVLLVSAAGASVLSRRRHGVRDPR